MSVKTSTETTTIKKQAWYSGWGKELIKNKGLYLMALPAVLYVFIFAYIPMGGIILAFKNYKFNLGIFESPWVGFDNFKYFVNSGKMLGLTINTLSYNLLFK